MKVQYVTLLDDGKRAIIVLRPNWLARWLGAPLITVELRKYDERVAQHDVQWRSLQTNRPLEEMSYGSMMLEALELRPTWNELPRAEVYERDGLRRNGAHVLVGTARPLSDDFKPSGES